MTKKKSHLRRTPRHSTHATAARTNAPDEDELSVEATLTKPILANPVISGTVIEDRVKIRPDPGDPTKDYTMPRVEAMKLLKQGKLRVSSHGGFEATEDYPDKQFNVS